MDLASSGASSLFSAFLLTRCVSGPSFMVVVWSVPFSPLILSIALWVQLFLGVLPLGYSTGDFSVNALFVFYFSSTVLVAPL